MHTLTHSHAEWHTYITACITAFVYVSVCQQLWTSDSQGEGGDEQQQEDQWWPHPPPHAPLPPPPLSAHVVVMVTARTKRWMWTHWMRVANLGTALWWSNSTPPPPPTPPPPSPPPPPPLSMVNSTNGTQDSISVEVLIGQWSRCAAWRAGHPTKFS